MHCVLHPPPTLLPLNYLVLRSSTPPGRPVPRRRFPGHRRLMKVLPRLARPFRNPPVLALDPPYFYTPLIIVDSPFPLDPPESLGPAVDTFGCCRRLPEVRVDEGAWLFSPQARVAECPTSLRLRAGVHLFVYQRKAWTV